MATITGLTAERMIAIEAASIVDGDVVGNNLILTRHDATTIDAGSVRGPTGSPGVTTGELSGLLASSSPVGSIIDYIGVVAPTNWLVMIGQTVVNAQTLYPALWAVIPAAMKSGSSLIMPETRGRVTAGYDATQTEFDAIGELGGSKTHTLTQAQLPAVPISIDPPATNLSVDPPATNVSINPPSTPVTGYTDWVAQSHVHAPDGSTGGFIRQRTGGPHGLDINAGTGVTIDVVTQTSAADTGHQHYFNGGALVDIAAFNATVDIAAFTATVDIAAFWSTNLGSGGSHPILQPYVTFLKIIKVL